MFREYTEGVSNSIIEQNRKNWTDLIFHLLGPVRDVEKTMFTGRNPMLKEILDYFLDDDITKEEKGWMKIRKTDRGLIKREVYLILITIQKLL